MSNFWGRFFHVFGVNFFFKFPHKKVAFIFIFLFFYFFKFVWNKAVFLELRTFSYLNVLYKGLLLQDWVFRLGLKLKTVKEE